MTIANAGARPFRWYHGWNIVTVCILSQAASLALTVNCFSLFLPSWTHQFHVPVSQLSISVLAFSLISAIVVPFAGAATDRFPARWIFGLALLALVGFHAAMGFTTAGWQIVLLYMALLPLAVGFAATVPSQAVVSRWFVRRVGLAMGLTAFGLALAGVVFPPVIEGLLPVLGWQRIWWLFAAVIGLIVLPLVVVVMRDRPTAEEGRYYVGDQPAEHKKVRLPVKEVFSRRNFWVTVGVFVPVQCCYMAVSINIAPLVISHGFSAVMAGLLISVMSISALVSKLVAGMIADKVGNRIPLVITPLISATGISLLAFSGHHQPLLIAAMILVGLAAGIWTLLASATAAEFGAEGFGGAFGLISMFTPLGSLAPPVVAYLQEASGSYIPALVGLAVFAVMGSAVGLLLKEKRRVHVDPALEAEAVEIAPAA
jgi:MFS family permease